MLHWHLLTQTFPTPSVQVILSLRCMSSFHLSIQCTTCPELGHDNSESSRKYQNQDMVSMELTWKAHASRYDSDLWPYIWKKQVLQEEVVWMENESRALIFIFSCFFSFNALLVCWTNFCKNWVACLYEFSLSLGV